MKDYVLDVLTEKHAKEVCDWAYENEYSVYNFSDWETVLNNGWDLAIKDKREREFMSITTNNQLIAYGRISTKEDKAFIGIGLKPRLCGKGHGKRIITLLVKEALKRYPQHIIALEVRYFNIRALKCYEKVGFEVQDQYTKRTFSGEEDEFYYMEYNKDVI